MEENNNTKTTNQVVKYVKIVLILVFAGITFLCSIYTV